MRSSLRNKLAAVTVFLLIAIVVVSGMTWATVSSFRLAEKNLTEGHERLASLALGRMDSHIGGILNSETSREHSDYLRLHRLPESRVVAVYDRDDMELDAATIVVHSPLAVSDPPHEWIDLYFEWHPSAPNKPLTSPQVADAEAIWDVDNPRGYMISAPRARRMLGWLKTALAEFDLHEQVAGVCTSDHARNAGEDEADRGEVASVGTSPSERAEVGRSSLSPEYQQRKQSLRDTQQRYLPPEECVDPVRPRGLSPTLASAFERGAGREGDRVPLTMDPFTAFWLGDGPDGNPKLAFVRECHHGAAVFYHGFVGDWMRLKPELLDVIRGVFPRQVLASVDLVPIQDDTEPGAGALETHMVNLPVRLSVPGIPGGATAAAWRSIRGTLITTWAAAAAALLVAGWGLRNLVALTERRMQFAYAVTHELRTPLTTFRLYSDMLSAGLVPDASRQEYLDTLDRESLRLSSLVEEVLEYARLESHRVRLNPTQTDGATLLQSIGETLERRCEENGIRASTENGVANGQPLRTDVELVNRIAGVLVNNACRHAKGRDDAAVLVRLDDDGSKLHLDVIDSGPGIDRADLRSIFRPFRRGRAADGAAAGGIGLGLALARSWATLLGGRLELAARHHPKYGGAHFRLTIPARIRT